MILTDLFNGQLHCYEHGKEILINKIDDYLDHAFATEEAEKRQKYREAVRQIEQLLLTVSEIE